jgi:hypothetical protein
LQKCVIGDFIKPDGLAGRQHRDTMLEHEVAHLALGQRQVMGDIGYRQSLTPHRHRESLL